MNERKALNILKRPLRFGDEEQIKAVRLIEELNTGTEELREVQVKLRFAPKFIMARGDTWSQVNKFVERWVEENLDDPYLFDDWEMA